MPLDLKRAQTGRKKYLEALNIFYKFYLLAFILKYAAIVLILNST